MSIGIFENHKEESREHAIDTFMRHSDRLAILLECIDKIPTIEIEILNRTIDKALLSLLRNSTIRED